MKIYSSSGKCVQWFSDGSKMLFVAFGFNGNERNVYVEKVREGGEKVQQRSYLLVLCPHPGFISHSLAHRKYHCLFSAASFVVPVNLILAKRGRNQGKLYKTY